MAKANEIYGDTDLERRSEGGKNKYRLNVLNVFYFQPLKTYNARKTALE